MAATRDGDLFSEAAVGNVQALRTLLDRYGRPLRDRLAGKIGKQWQSILDADDVMQVTYLEAFLQIDQFAARDAAAFVSWLTRIAENNLRDAIKALERQKRPDPRRRVQIPAGEDSLAALIDMLGVTSATPSRDAARNENAQILEAVLAKLPPDYAAAVRLYDLQGRSAKEAAAELNRSVGAFYILRSRAHDRLRALLGSASQFFSKTV